jgi:AcrR family transcriptional regulator
MWFYFRMPRISAPTVAEHRARQRTALLDAARRLLEERGYTALTFGALADRTGLARPTVYEYFASKDELVVALCEREIGRQAELVRGRLEGATGPRERVAAFVRAQLDLAVEEPRLVAPPGAEVPVGAAARARIRELHQRLASTLTEALGDLDEPDRALLAGLVQGVVNAAIVRIRDGDAPERVLGAAVGLVLEGLDGAIR